MKTNAWTLFAIVALTFSMAHAKSIWHTYEKTALFEAKKQERILMIYFCGSDWEPYTQTLDKQVLDTDTFTNFAKENIVCLKVDFGSPKMKQSSLTKKRNNELKDKYNVTLFPTFVFVDHTGRVLSRAFYDDAKLREKEKKGSPMAWMSYIDKVGDMKPEGTQLKLLNGLPEGRKAALRHELPLLMVVSDPRSPSQKERTDRFLNDPGVIRFVNSTMKVTHIVPTDRSDRSIEGRSFRAFKVQHNLPNSSPQIVIYDVVKDKIVYRAGSFAGGRVKSVLMQIEKALPKIPYNGEWIEDYQKGKAIAAQTKRTIVLSFIGSDWDPYSQQLQREIYDVKEFQDYAKDNLVLVKFDYPKKKAQSEEIKQQNKQLADIYSIRGYPTVVILNAGGQLIAKAGYQKGGPKPFLAEVKAVRRKDLARHDHPSQW